MKFNKKGAVHPALVIFGVIIAFIVVLAVFGSVSTWFGNLSGSSKSLTSYISDSKSVYELALEAKQASFTGPLGVNELSYLKPVSYIIGEIPQAIVDASSPIGAIIVIVLVFAILVMMFGDILDTFGTFSAPWVAWTIGVALAIIAANLKVVMLFAVSGFALVSGVGILAALLGVLVPFLIYIILHVLFISNFKNIKNRVAFRQGVADVVGGVRASKTFAKAVRGP